MTQKEKNWNFKRVNMVNSGVDQDGKREETQQKNRSALAVKRVTGKQVNVKCSTRVVRHKAGGTPHLPSPSVRT
jgi:hypothetical protein